MVSELTAKHNEEIIQLRTELRESMEAAHQAELQQAQVYYVYMWTYSATTCCKTSLVSFFFFFFSLIKYFIVKGILSVTMNFTPNTLYWYLVTIEIQEFNLVLLCTSYKLLLMVTMPVKCLKCNYNTYAVTTRLRKSSNRTLCLISYRSKRPASLKLCI